MISNWLSLATGVWRALMEKYIYIYIYTGKFIYVYIYIHTNLPVIVIARPFDPRSGDSQGQEMFLATSADRKTRNYDIECSNHHPSQLSLRPKGLSPSKMKWWAIYTNLPVNVIARLPHPWRGDSQGQETFLAPFADKQTRNYDIECSNHHPSQSSLRPKGLSPSKMKWWAYIQIYQWMSQPDYPILRAEITRARKRF